MDLWDLAKVFINGVIFIFRWVFCLTEMSSQDRYLDFLVIHPFILYATQITGDNRNKKVGYSIISSQSVKTKQIWWSQESTYGKTQFYVVFFFFEVFQCFCLSKQFSLHRFFSRYSPECLMFMSFFHFKLYFLITV